MPTQTQEQILAFLLSHQEEHHTIRGIARKLKKSYTLVYNNIIELEKNSIITRQSVPPASIVKLNEFAPNEVFIDIELKRKKEFLEKHPWLHVALDDILSSAKNPFFILLVFGSYAKGTQTKKSDIDLLAIMPHKKDMLEVEHAVERAYTPAKKGLNIIDMADYIKMIGNANELNVGNESKKHHIILYGAEIYYQLLKEAYKR